MELYGSQYNNDLFEFDSSGTVCLQATHSKSQELAEEVNKKKNIRTIEEIVPNYILK